MKISRYRRSKQDHALQVRSSRRSQPADKVADYFLRNHLCPHSLPAAAGPAAAGTAAAESTKPATTAKPATTPAAATSVSAAAKHPRKKHREQYAAKRSR